MRSASTCDDLLAPGLLSALERGYLQFDSALKFMTISNQSPVAPDALQKPPHDAGQLQRRRAALGFSAVGVMSSRSVMLPELAEVLHFVPQVANAAAYRHAVVQDNVLHKASASNRDKTYDYLHRPYALDPSVAIFREMRRLIGMFPTDLIALASLLALAREPLLRACADMVLSLAVGQKLGREQFESWVREVTPGRHSQAMYRSFSHNLYASFFQMGYLGDAVAKCRLRRRPDAGPAATAYAAFLDWLNGANGISILQATHSRTLELPRDDHLRLLSTAGQLGLMSVAHAGGVLHLDFSPWLQPGEARLTQ